MDRSLVLPHILIASFVVHHRRRPVDIVVNRVPLNLYQAPIRLT